jgi:beta-galactosidase/beta-glucuronidase
MNTSVLNSLRSQFILSGPWKYQYDQDQRGELDGWFEPAFPHVTWADAKVPGAWNFYNLALWAHDGPIWFATEIPASAVQPGLRQCLVFQRVSMHAHIWLNGQYVGEHFGGDLPFQFPVSSLLSPQSANRLVLRVDTTPRADLPPGTPMIERLVYGGILKPVILESTSPVFIDLVRITGKPAGTNAIISGKVVVSNTGFSPLPANLEIILSLDGKALAASEQVVRVEPGQEFSAAIDMALPGARPWSPEEPNLYDYSVRLLDTTGTCLDAVSGRFGVRSIEVVGKEIHLNGKPILVQGVNRYDEVAGVGPVVPIEQLRADLLKVKQSGTNFIRVHYPQDPDLLDLLDEIGLLIMEEVFINWWGVNWWKEKIPGVEETAPTVIPAAERMLEDLIRRDGNHPSVVAWSMANESATSEPAGIAGMAHLMRRAKELDTTRLVTFVAAGDPRPHSAFQEADIVCANFYPGVFGEKLAYHIADFDERVAHPMLEILEAITAHYDKPIVITEYGCHGIEGLCGDARYSEDYQSAYIQAVWQAIRSVPGIQGGVLWAWADYYHRNDFCGAGMNSPFGPFGAVTVDRREKKAFRALCSMYGGRED